MSDYVNEEEEKTRLNNCFNTYNKGLKTELEMSLDSKRKNTIYEKYNSNYSSKKN